MLSSCSGFGHVNLHQQQCSSRRVYCVCTGTDTCKDTSSTALAGHSLDLRLIHIAIQAILHATVVLMVCWYREVVAGSDCPRQPCYSVLI